MKVLRYLKTDLGVIVDSHLIFYIEKQYTGIRYIYILKFKNPTDLSSTPLLLRQVHPEDDWTKWEHWETKDNILSVWGVICLWYYLQFKCPIRSGIDPSFFERKKNNTHEV